MLYPIELWVQPVSVENYLPARLRARRYFESAECGANLKFCAHLIGTWRQSWALPLTSVVKPEQGLWSEPRRSCSMRPGGRAGPSPTAQSDQPSKPSAAEPQPNAARQLHRRDAMTTALQSRDRTARSVWSAWSLLPLFARYPGIESAAGRTHSIRFASPAARNILRSL